jgi:hypothetical protein
MDYEEEYEYCEPEEERLERLYNDFCKAAEHKFNWMESHKKAYIILGQYISNDIIKYILNPYLSEFDFQDMVEFKIESRRKLYQPYDYPPIPIYRIFDEDVYERYYYDNTVETQRTFFSKLITFSLRSVSDKDKYKNIRSGDSWIEWNARKKKITEEWILFHNLLEIKSKEEINDDVFFDFNHMYRYIWIYRIYIEDRVIEREVNVRNVCKDGYSFIWFEITDEDIIIPGTSCKVQLILVNSHNKENRLYTSRIYHL